jgi:hypothetical protein
MAKLNKLISDHLKLLASEETELASDNETKISRAHKLALILWQKALGTGPIELDAKTGKIKRTGPDTEIIKLVLERIDGKVLNTDEIKQRDESIPDRISKVGKDKINNL